MNSHNIFFIIIFFFYVFICLVSDRAKVSRGLPDVVAIREGKVCHCQGILSIQIVV